MRVRAILIPLCAVMLSVGLLGACSSDSDKKSDPEGNVDPAFKARVDGDTLPPGAVVATLPDGSPASLPPGAENIDVRCLSDELNKHVGQEFEAIDLQVWVSSGGGGAVQPVADAIVASGKCKK